jgi:signal transduction histidine kinase
MATFRRRIILINRPFQIRFCAYICAWVLALCFIYPVFISNLFDYFVRYVALDPANADIGSLTATRKEIIRLVIITESAFLILTFMLGLFISHRIAGPLYKVRRCFEEFSRGGFDRKLYFRKRDYFPELASDFNKMVASFREREIRENEILATAAARIESVMKTANDQTRTELETALISIRKLQEQRTPLVDTVMAEESVAQEETPPSDSQT